MDQQDVLSMVMGKIINLLAHVTQHAGKKEQRTGSSGC
jgi:hypothetical protein